MLENALGKTCVHNLSKKLNEPWSNQVCHLHQITGLKASRMLERHKGGELSSDLLLDLQVSQGQTFKIAFSHVECLLVALLRPFWRIAKVDFGPFDPKARCYAHCASLMDTIWTFRAFVSLNCEYWYNHTIATIAFVCFQEHADSPVQTETLIKACKCLHEMTGVFPLAADSLSAIRGAFKLAGMPVPTYLQPFLESGVKHRKDGLLHHSAAKLLPGGDGSALDAAQQEMKYQQLLDKLDSVGLD